MEMLKSITVQNFAYYKDKQTLTFEDGAYYLIGENDSGKTSLFEIIRGCMSASKIYHLTRPHDRDKPSFALCCFQAGPEKQRMISALIRLKTEDHDDTKSHGDTEGRDDTKRHGDTKYHGDTKDIDDAEDHGDTKDHDDTYLKLIYVKEIKRHNESNAVETNAEQELPEIELKWIPGILEVEYRIGDHEWQPVNFKSSEDLRKLRNDLLKELNKPRVEDISGDQIVTIFESCVTSKYGTPEEAGISGTNDCEVQLKEYVNKATVVTFPMRGISSCQWTESLQPPGQTEYSEEIITWYLTTTDNISSEEKEQEKEYFRLITNNSGVNFSYKDSKLVLKNAAFHGEESSILTLSEGIYEAKKLSVLLAVKRFQTVCLEEPDRGMHPQMIERIRDLVLPQACPDKVVLITTHHPSFISPSTLPRVYKFRRRYENNGPRCIATVKLLLPEKDKPGNKSETKGACGNAMENPGTLKGKPNNIWKNKFDASSASPNKENPDASKRKQESTKKNKKGKNKKGQGEEHEDKTVRLVTSGASPLIFFATKLLLVEGQGDYIFMSHLRQVLMTRGDLMKCFIAQSSEKTTSIEEMKHFLCSLHIVPMIGEANKDKYRKFCERMETLAFFLMDKDALTNNIPGNTPGKKTKAFLQMFKLDHSESMCERVQADVSVLEQYRLFIWTGTIERAAASLSEPSLLKRTLSEPSLSVSSLANASLSKRSLSEPSLSKPSLSEPSLSKASLSEPSLAKASLSEPSLSKRSLVKPKRSEALKCVYDKNNVKLEYNKLKEGKKPGLKIFSDKQLTNKNIRTVVEEIVVVSNGDYESEFHRVILFLIKMRKHSFETQLKPL